MKIFLFFAYYLIIVPSNIVLKMTKLLNKKKYEDTYWIRPKNKDYTKMDDDF